VQGIALYKWIEQLMDPNQPDPASVEPSAEEILAELYNQTLSSDIVV